MAQQGEDVLLLAEQLALTETDAQVGNEVALYGKGVGRDGSTVAVGSDVALVADDKAQGPGGAISLGVLQGDTALYKGDTLSLFIPATNNRTEVTTYTVDFTEDGDQFDTVTKDIPPAEEITYDTQVTKQERGCFTYQANESNEHRACWMNIRPGPLRADPESIWLGGDDLSTRLNIRIETPSAETDSQDIDVDFYEDGAGQVGSEAASIDPGSEYTFDTTVSRNTEQEVRFFAEITNNNTGISVETNEVVVLWTDNQDAVFELGQLEPSDYTPVVGDSIDLTIPVSNEYTEALDYTLDFYEDSGKFGSVTNTVQSRSTREYQQSRSKSSTTQHDYRAEDPSKTNVSNTVTVTWMLVDIGRLKAGETVLTPNESTDLTLTVSNPTGNVQTVLTTIEEDGTPIYDEGADIDPGDSYTFSTTVSEDSESVHDYRAYVEDNSGQTAETNPVTVDWTEAGIYADTGSGLYELSPKTVGSHSGWYSYGSPKDYQANHGEFLFGATAVHVLYDGSSYAISITHHDASDDLNKQWATDTFFSPDQSGYIVKDDPESIEPVYDQSAQAYFSDKMRQGWGGGRTDGAVIAFPSGKDQTISITGDSSGITLMNTGDFAGNSIRLVNNT